MRILVIDAGGRGAAIEWKLAQDGHTVFRAPGNAGTAEIGKNFPVEISNIEALRNLAKFVNRLAPQ